MGTYNLSTIYGADPEKRLRKKRYSQGTIVSIAGGYAKIDVGAVLPDGTAVQLNLPLASGFTPTVGQTAVIHYPNDNPNGAYIAAIGSSAAAPSGTASHGLMDHTDSNSGTATLNLAGVKVGGNQVVGARQAAISDVTLTTTETSGATYTSNEQDMLTHLKADNDTLKTQVNSMLAILRTHGLITT